MARVCVYVCVMCVLCIYVTGRDYRRGGVWRAAGQAEASLWGSSGWLGKESLALDTGCGGAEEGSGAVECVWGLNQPEPGCSLIQLSCGAPEAPTGAVAKPHPRLNQVSPVSVGT